VATAQDEQAIRAAFDAYTVGDLDALLGLFSPDLEWTFLDPGVADPEPRTCRGVADLERALHRQSAAGLSPVIEDLAAHGDKVAITIHVPGLDRLRVRQNDDRNYEVLTVERGQIVAMRACRSRAEALLAAGIE
jgi:ketosteroid isomerase-like protein